MTQAQDPTEACGRQGWQARSLLGSVMLSDFSILEPSELSELGGRQ